MMTPLHIAATYGSAVIVEYLLANGSNTEAQNLDGMTPLLIASYKGHQNVVLLLLHSGCEINVFDNEGNTALHLACMAGHNSCVKALVFYAESVGLLLGFNSQNKYGDTALHLASHWGYSSVVKFLMSQSSVTLSCLDVRNKRNQAPIDCAHDSAISALLNKNACNEKNSDHSRLILLDLNNLSIKNKTMATSPISHPLISKEDISNECDEGSITLRKILKAIHVGDLKLACFYLDISDPIIPSNPILNASQKCHPLCQCRKCFNGAQAKPIKCNLSLMNQIGENHGVLHASVSALNLELAKSYYIMVLILILYKA
ncbi:UNVERIFIED_CONTAM: hypothetical protein GTU68_025237 [Idotea baltica]|nr:hypothetical protein [Idotea baltica]